MSEAFSWLDCPPLPLAWSSFIHPLSLRSQQGCNGAKATTSNYYYIHHDCSWRRRLSFYRSSSRKRNLYLRNGNIRIPIVLPQHQGVSLPWLRRPGKSILTIALGSKFERNLPAPILDRWSLITYVIPGYWLRSSSPSDEPLIWLSVYVPLRLELDGFHLTRF